MTETDTATHERDDQAEARWAATTRASEAALASARQIESEAFDRVDDARAEKGMGRASASVVIRAQRALAAAQEATSTAEAVVRRTARDIQAERDARERARIDAARVERRATESIRAASLVRARECFRLIGDALDEINLLEGIPSLTTYAGDYSRLRDALGRLASRY